MSDYATDAADALVSIKEAGRQAVLRRLTRVTNLGKVTEVTSTGGIIDMVILPLGREPFDNDDLKEAFIQGRLRKLLVAAVSAPFEIESLDVVLFEDAYWTVHGCTPLKPSTIPIIYNMIVENTDLTAMEIAALELTDDEEAIAEL